MTGIVAVRDLPSDVCGAIVYWRLDGATNLENLAAAWAEQGLDPEELPQSTSPEIALRQVAQSLRERDRVVLPLRVSHGWALVRANVDDTGLDARVECRLTLDDRGLLRVTPPDHQSREELERLFMASLDGIQQGALSGWLVRRCFDYSCVALRDTGGIYFVPRDGLAGWRRVAGALTQSTRHVLHEIPAVRSEEAVRALAEAIAEEAQQAARRMSDALATGELGARALKSRIDETNAVLAKVRQYEEMLGVTLTAVSVQCNDLRIELTAAALAAEAETDQGSAE